MTYINAGHTGLANGATRPATGTSRSPAGVAPGGAADEREARLRQVAGQLQGVFVEQLFKAMRETVPTDGITSGGSGEQMFAGMLDQHLANAVPSQWSHGIGESLMRQLRARTTTPATTATEAVK
ncbi:MAG: rod-binding protein [Gemmatimonadaceae bacterium]|nr:rod-binding protein [Gemmatimonadaceae bacterium]